MKKLILYIILILMLSDTWKAKALNKIDSLLTICEKASVDSIKIKIYVNIGDILIDNSPDSALLFYSKALNLLNIYFISIKDNNILKPSMLLLKASILRNIGDVDNNKGNFVPAINFYKQSLYVFEQLKDKKNIAECLKNIGLLYDELSNFSSALDQYLKALKIFEEIGDKKGISVCYTDIGNINAYQNNYSNALTYYIKSLKIKEEIGDKKGIANCNGNIGAIYTGLRKYDLAIEYYVKSINSRIELGDKKGLAICYDNLGELYFFKGNYQKSIKFSEMSLSIYEEINDKEGISLCNINIAGAYNSLREFNVAIIYSKKSLDFSKEIGSLICERYAEEQLSKSYEGLCNYMQALYHYQQFKILNDSIFNNEKQKQLTKMEAIYQGEKKQKEIEILEKDKKLKKIEFRRVQFQKYGFIAGFILMMLLAIIVLRNYSQKQKENLLLNQQKAEIEEKNEELNQQNEEIATQRDENEAQRDKLIQQQKDINDSLEYASLIQHTLLSSEDILKTNFPDYFILYKPRDIISGDFYWFKQIKNFLFVVVADCTGHGVPGAFMSVLGISLLNDIVGKRALDPPAEILFELRKRIKKSLRQDNPETVNQDGMDIAFCCIDMEILEMQYAGAYNPLYLIRHNELIEYKANHMPVGVHPHDKENFTNHTLQLQKNDTFYIFSDGFTSQFGGPEGKKFNSKPFKKLILGMNPQSMPAQKLSFDKTLAEWQKNHEQIDDISIIGVRV